MFFFFFNDTATTEIYTLSLHDALPISAPGWSRRCSSAAVASSSRSPSSVPNRTATTTGSCCRMCWPVRSTRRSEEHTSELQSRQYLVCRLLLEKKKHKQKRLRISRDSF